MSRVLVALAAVLALSGCSLLDLSKPRAYPCAPDGGEGQCPDSWRCGLEGQCHQIGVAAAYACATDTDCESGWRCGSEGTCLNPDAEALRANDDGGAVTLVRLSPNTFQGLPEAAGRAPENFYQVSFCDRNTGMNSMTLVQNGQLQKYVEFNMPVRMFPDGGRFTDGGACPDDAGIAYIDKAYDVVTVPFDGGGRALAIADQGLRSYVLAEDGGFCTFAYDPAGTLTGGCSNLGFAATRLRRADEFEYPFLVASSESTYAVFSTHDGGLVTNQVAKAKDGGVLRMTDLVAVGEHWSALPILHAATPNGLFIRRTSGVSMYDGGTLPAGVFEPAEIDQLSCNVNAEQGYQVPLSFHSPKVNQGPSEHRLGILARSDYSAGQFDERVLIYESSLLATPADTTPEFYQCMPLPDRGWDYYNRWSFDQSLTYCNPCEYRETASDIRTTYEPLDTENELDQTAILKVQAVCAPADGGMPQLRYSIGQENDCRTISSSSAALPESPRFHRPLVHDRVSSMQQMQVDDLGHFWRDDYDFATNAIVLDRTPTALLETPDGLRAFASAQKYGDTFEERSLLVTSNATYKLRGNQGFWLDDGDTDVPVFADVDGEPRWALVGQREENSNLVALIQFIPFSGGYMFFRFVAHFNTEETYGRPFRGALAKSSNGKSVLLMSSFDALLAADVTDRMDLGVIEDDFDMLTDFFDSPQLQIRLIPLSRTPITSLVAIPPDDTPGADVSYVEGYLLQANRIFRFHAPNPTVWRAEELLLDQAEPLEVFADGRRGRVGLVDGSVWSLPSRIQLAPPLPAGAGAALDYAQMCAHTFVLTEQGLFRLIADGGPLGSWSEVTIDASVLPDAARSFQGAKLFPRTEGLYLTLSNGYVIQAQGTFCP